MLKRPARFYNASSSECFGDVAGEPADEGTPFRPRSPYGVAKAAAFWQVSSYREAYGLYACSGILFNHESPLRPERFVTQKVVAAACRIAAGSKERLRLGDLSVRRDWGWAPEYVDAMWRMLQTERARRLRHLHGRDEPALGLRRRGLRRRRPARRRPRRAGQEPVPAGRPPQQRRLAGQGARAAGLVGLPTRCATSCARWWPPSVKKQKKQNSIGALPDFRV